MSTMWINMNTISCNLHVTWKKKRIEFRGGKYQVNAGEKEHVGILRWGEGFYRDAELDWESVWLHKEGGDRN